MLSESKPASPVSPAPPVTPATPTPGDGYKGWLFKWTNYIKGYQRRWFVLTNGLLSYYRNQAEMGHTCRGTINLATASITVEDSCNFVISNGGAQTYHLKASSEVERQRWITALELAVPSDDSADESSETASASGRDGVRGMEFQSTLRALGSKVEDLSTCNDLIVKQGSALQRSLSELEGLPAVADAGEKIRQVTERATLFRITSDAMIKACRDFLSMAQNHSKRWQKALQLERAQRLRLEDTLEQLAKQHNHLERAFRGVAVLSPASYADAHLGGKGLISSKGDASDEDDDDSEFFDAMEDPADFITVPADPECRRRSGSVVSGLSNETAADDMSLDELSLASASTSASTTASTTASAARRRTRIPEKPDYYLNLWSVMKNCIGKELSKIPMPVNFNEPLSMLQRLTEDLEYHQLLDKAAKCGASLEQMCYVAAFTVSSYSTTVQRTGKPFNPLLGETFELDRLQDCGYRSLCEQVSHHPPAAAHHAFSENGWTLRQEIVLASKFRGKYLSIIPLGSIQCIFEKSGNHYSWKKVTTTVHNIIVGKLWIDQSGEIDVLNHKTGDRCHLKFSPYSYFSRDVQRKVTGVVTDAEGKAHYVLSGTWDDKLELSRILHSSTSADADGGGEGKQRTVYQTLKAKEIWRKNPLPEGAESMYYFSALALTLNEDEEGVAPTDSRRRPDQRLMEEGRWDSANGEKQRLEEKQRAARRERQRRRTSLRVADDADDDAEADRARADEMVTEASEDESGQADNYQALWFHKANDPVSGETLHVYKGGYWETKDGGLGWDACPDIF